MHLPAAGNPPAPRAQTPPATLVSAASASTGSLPARLENRPLHRQPVPDPAPGTATSAGAAGGVAGVAEARDAHFADLIRATAMQPMVACVYEAMPSAQARLVAFGQWVIRHADALGQPTLAQRTPNSAARGFMAQLPLTGHPASKAATGYVTVLFNTVFPDPDVTDRHAVSLLRSALSQAPQPPAEDAGAPR